MQAIGLTEKEKKYRAGESIRVLFVISQFGLGGTEKNLVELVLGLDRTRFEPRVLVFKGGGENEAALRDEGIEVCYVQNRLGKYPSRLLSIYRACKDFEPHVLQSFDVISGIYCGPIGRIARCPFVSSTMFSALLPTGLRRAMRVVWPQLDMIVCNNRVARHYLNERCGVPLERTTLIANGLDFGRMEAGRHYEVSLRAELGIPEGRPIIGLVGKLNDDKHPMTLAQAAVKVRETLPEVAFCIIGSGPHRARLEAFIEGEGLQQHVFLVPRRPDAAWLAREFDVGVLCSSTEGLPTAVTEYMYWAKPCVVTDVGDCSYVVRDGETGYVVPPGNPDALAVAIVKLTNNPLHAQQMGRAGLHRLHDLFSIERYVDDYQRLYERAMTAVCQE